MHLLTPSLRSLPVQLPRLPGFLLLPFDVSLPSLRPVHALPGNGKMVKLIVKLKKKQQWRRATTGHKTTAQRRIC